MGLTDNGLQQFLHNRSHLVASQPRSVALSVGAPDFWCTWPAISKAGITTIREDEVSTIKRATQQDYCRLSKSLIGKLFEHLGYDSYYELDIWDRADIIHDMNYPVPPDLHQRFDLIWENGTVEHIANVNQALQNIVEMTRVGGRIVHTQGIGDQTNFGYWTISPSFYADFYTANGFRVDVMQLVDRRKHIVPYHDVTSKGSFVGSLIPLRHVPGYYLRQMRADLLLRISRQSPGTERMLNLPARAGFVSEKKGLRQVARCLYGMQVVWNWLLGRNATAGPDWNILVVATRVGIVDRPKSPIQCIYRKFDQGPRAELITS